MQDKHHPTGGVPERVIMLLLGESKQDYANMLAVSHDPCFPPSEVWTCNAGFRIWRHDLLFLMDDFEQEAYKWPQYGKELAAHDRPIITSTVYPRAGRHMVAYPFTRICQDLELKHMDRYFFNTVPYMLAYALWIGVKHVTLFGADYHHPHAAGREGDVENAHWWLGYLRAKGVAISVANSSTLMGARNVGRPLYGYRFDPRVTLDRPQHEDDPLSAGAQALVDGDDAPKQPGDAVEGYGMGRERRVWQYVKESNPTPHSE